MVGWFCLAAIIAIGLAAVQLAPTAELQMTSQRAGGVEPDFAMTYSLWPMRIISFFAPRFFGHPATGDYWGYCCNYWEDNGYVGVLPLVLAMGVTLAWLRWRWSHARADALIDHIPVAGTIVPFFSVAALASLVLASGIHTPIYPLVFHHVPGFGQFQAPARLLCIWTIAISVLAALGAERWRPTPRLLRAGRYSIAIGCAFLLAAVAAGAFLSDQTGTFRLGTAQLGTSLVSIGILALLQPRSAKRARDRHWSAAVLLFIAVDLVWANWGGNPTAEPWLYARRPESASKLQAAGIDGSTFIASADEYTITFDHFLSFRTFAPASGHKNSGEAAAERWFDMREALIPNVGILDQLPSLNNFDPLRPARHELLIEAINTATGPEQVSLLQMAGVSVLTAATETSTGLDPLHRSSDVIFYRIPDPLPRAYIAYQAIPVPDLDAAQREVARPGFDPHELVVVETDAPIPDLQSPITPVALTHTSRGARMRVSPAADGVLVFVDTLYPGWTATIDGKPAAILPANLAFKAVRVPAGEHLIEFSYEPRSFTYGAGATIVSIFLTGLFALVGWLPNREAPGQGRANESRAR